MTVDELLTYYDQNGAKAARALNLNRRTVHNWRAANKIPSARQFQIQVLTKGVLKADKEETQNE